MAVFHQAVSVETIQNEEFCGPIFGCGKEEVKWILSSQWKSIYDYNFQDPLVQE